MLWPKGDVVEVAEKESGAKPADALVVTQLTISLVEQGAGHDRDAERDRQDVPVETKMERSRRRQWEVRGHLQVEQPDR